MSFEDGFANVPGQEFSLYEMADRINEETQREIVLIIDESQLLYNHISTTIWEDIKSGTVPENVKILLVSFYGENSRFQNGGTPVMFNDSQRLGLHDLLFPKRVVSDYLKSIFDLPNESMSDSDTCALCDAIYAATNGHIGLLLLITENMESK
mmetsp:Transcript_21410/g.31001  ORF Transcript_21410/g.31001 Transcript_21410/m.31001 type:complete len:153 (+) Transcript_21410:300-758(+)|eukprot:CAMPEP_0185021456 /NCGR_PEP_ID=MMETSP1103-20130426/4136_1 /TAXON_ID=36769 /ORGANISM="Paraphysomonas bandaiensis, Strain Caron Lab Isolate" /LENGTH=152 /DNA_ID=CAMNT_0027552981 /DNA_START=273 /DNA_END=731 /DNA_ORIENTATION=+